MKSKWLNNQNNENIIVFFNGWGMDEKIVEHLLYGNYDVLMFYDYRTFEEIKFDFSKYKNKYLIAWSMGVIVSSLYYEIFNGFDKKIAINGTLKPINDEYGIPVLIYNLMIENFNEISSEKFVKKISSGNNTKEYCTRSMTDLKEELINIKNVNPTRLIEFDKAIVSLKDRIMPAKNQIKYWTQQNIEVEKKEGLHSIFDQITNWGNLI